MINPAGTLYYHADGLGSILALSDSSKAIVQRYKYDSFGTLTAIQDTEFGNTYTYTAREWDRELGLYYYRARYYDAMEGRFISKDPLNFSAGDVNLFRYVLGNPINFIDPFGLDTWFGVYDEWDMFVLFGGKSGGTGWLTNQESGEKCNFEVKCYKVGVGFALPSESANLIWVLNGPHSGQSLAGTSVGGGLDFLSPSGSGGVDKSGAVTLTGGLGVSTTPSGSIYGYKCETKITKCECPND